MSRTSSQRRCRRLLALAILGSSASFTFAQPTDAPATPDNAIGIFVRDSAVAAEKLALAERMERAHEWDTSAEVYQEVVDRFTDRVIATHTDAQGRTDRYGGVATVVQDRIAAWPADGQRAYLDRYEAPAARMLASADPADAAAMAAVINRYFVTTAGRDAALRLLDRDFNEGQFVAAASLADRLIDHHPAVDAAMKPMLLLRSALAWHLAGDATRAAARADLLARDFGQVRATLGGQDRLLTEVASAALAQNAAATNATMGARWTEPFGTPDHAAVAREPAGELPAEKPREWARLLSITLEPAKPSMGNGPDANAIIMRQQMFGGATSRMRDLGAMTGILPAVDGDTIFFQDNARVYARSLLTGTPLPGWAATYPSDDGRFRVPEAVSTPRGAQMSVTLAGRYVLAILGQPEPAAMFTGGPGATRSQVVCLDRDTGRLLWSTRMSDLNPPRATGDVDPRAPQADLGQGRRDGNPAAAAAAEANTAAQDAESLRQTNPCGSVLVVNDAAYVVTRGGRGNAIIDTFLVCIDLATGSPRWTRHLASGNSTRSQYGFDPISALSDVASSHLAYADGRIYACTDLGALAAVDASDGSVAWIAAYPRPRPENTQPWMNPTLRTTARIEPAFAGNPVIVRDGRVITLPVDGEFLFVNDAIDGHEIARLRLKAQIDGEDTADTAEVLAGISGDRVVLASSRAVSLIDLTKLVGGPGANAAAPREVAFDQALVRRMQFRKPGFEDDAIRGRVCITEHSVFVPTAWRLLRLDLQTLVARDQYPASDDWNDRRDESPGNATVVGDRVLVAASNRISVFAELTQLRTRLDAQIAAEPDNVLPRVQYAEALFNAGRDDEALGMIDAATQRIANPFAGQSEPERRSLLFDLTMNRLRDHTASNKPNAADAQAETATNLASQQALLARAASLARTADQQVAYRLAAATVARSAKDYAGVIALYQEILDNPTWSIVRVRVRNAREDVRDRGESELLAAAKVATLSIDRTLEAAGDPTRAAYAAVEARAAASLEQARAAGADAPAGGPGALFAIARQFPNAKAAKDAVALAGELLTRPGGPPADRRALRELAAHAPDAAARVALSEAMLRSFLAADDINGALGRARRLAWADAKRALSGPLPDLTDGTSLADASNAGAAVARLQAIGFARQEQRLPDLRASFAGNSFDVGHAVESREVGRLLQPASLINRGAVRAGTRNDRVIGLTRTSVRQVQIFKPGVAQPIASVDWVEPANNAAIVPSWLEGDRVLLRQQNRVGCIDVAGGKLAWSLDVPGLDATSADGGNGGLATVTAPARGDAGARVVEVDPSGIALLETAPAAPVAEAGQGNNAAADPMIQQIEQAVARGDIDAATARRAINQAVRAQAQMAARGMPQLRLGGGIVRVNGRIFVNGQPAVLDANGNLVEGEGGPWQADPRPAADAAETIVDARTPGGAATGMIVVVTSRGRLIGVDDKTGTVRWRANVADRAPAFVGVVDERVVIVSTDEQASSLVVVDAVNGSEAMRRSFGDSTSAPGKRITGVALSDEGFAVFATATELSLFDLAGGDPEPVATQPVAVMGGMIDPGVQPANLTSTNIQFCGGKLLVLSSAGVGSEGDLPIVRALELSTLAPVTSLDPKTGQTAEQRFIPAFPNNRGRRGDEQVNLRVHKDRLFINVGTFFKSYPVLDPKQMPWSRTPTGDAPTVMSVGSPMLVRDGVLVIGWPPEFGAGAAPAARVELYSRQTVEKSQEVGMLAEDIELHRANAKLVNDAFQCVDGGIYYLSTDGTLIFLPGKPQ